MSFPFAAKAPCASSSPEGWGRRLRRGFAADKRRRRRHCARDAATRLIYEPLEPRLLLSADIMAVDLTGTPDAELDNSLLVRLIEEAETIGDYAVSVSMIEIVDEDSGDVLQTAELDGIREIRILTGEGDDRVRIDVGSFGDQSLPSISFDGGVGNDELVLDGGAGSQNWTIDGANSGVLDGVVDGTFDDVEAIIGADTTDDHFTLSDQGSLSGGLEGGDGG